MYFIYDDNTTTLIYNVDSGTSNSVSNNVKQIKQMHGLFSRKILLLELFTSYYFNFLRKTFIHDLIFMRVYLKLNMAIAIMAILCI